VIIGTAGHVNHGKTTLVRALTGTDCDRLAEEKRRGITIQLGFASWSLPDGRQVSVVDVPGHASLGHTMATGALGLDAVLLVVAAHEGVMPQTREHLAACQVLGVRRGIIVVTHVDRCEDPDAASAAIRASLQSSFLADAPLVGVNAPDGVGLEALGAAAVKVLTATGEAQGLPALLPIDRVFAMRGFGTVVTGSLIRGRLQADDQVVLAPSGRTLRVRTMHVHGQQVTEATARCRVGVGLPGIEPAEIHRGAFLASPGQICVGHRFDAEIEWQSHMPRSIRQARSLGFVCGAARAQARFNADGVLEPGGRGTARVMLDRDLPLVGGLRFVLRGATVEGFGSVVAGGRILDAAPPTRRTAAVRAALAEGRDPVEEVVDEADGRGVAPQELGRRLGLPPLPEGALMFSNGALQRAGDRVLRSVGDFQAAHPRELGMPTSALGLDPVVEPALAGLIETGKLRRDGPLLRTPDFDVSQQSRQASDLSEQVARHIEEAGLHGPSEADVLEHFSATAADVNTAIRALESQQRIVRSKAMCFSAMHTERLMQDAATAVVEHGPLPVAWIKQYASVTRKHAIPLWTWLDRIGITVRDGNLRVAGPRARQLIAKRKS